MAFQTASDNRFPDETAAATNGNAEKSLYFPISNGAMDIINTLVIFSVHKMLKLKN